MHVVLSDPVVTDHLESALEMSIIKLSSGVREAQNEGLVSVMLEHEFTEARLLVHQVTLLLELIVGGTATDRRLSASAPLLNQTLNGV